MKQFHTITIILLLFIVAGKAQITWTEFRTIKQGLYDIHCVNDSVLYVCGEGGFIQKSIDAGKTWTLLHEESGIRWQVIKFLDEQTGFVGGGEVLNFITPVENGGILRKTIDGGLSWQDITPKDSINIIQDIHFEDEDTLYIMYSGTLLKSIDRGNTWDTAFFSETREIINFHMNNSVAYMIAEGLSPSGIKIHKTLDYAKTWEEINIEPSFYTSFGSDLVFFHQDTVYAYMPKSLLYTTDGFITYETQPYLEQYSSVKAKRFPNGNYCLITYDVHDGYYFYGNINGTFFYEDGVPDYIAVDGCSDSIFYVAQYWGRIYTNRYFEPVNAIIDIDKESFSIFPNPTNGQLRITNYELRDGDITIYDIMGKQLSFKAPSPLERAGGEVKIDISHLPVGMYFLRIETEKGSITKKIIKK